MKIKKGGAGRNNDHIYHHKVEASPSLGLLLKASNRMLNASIK
jgi:hypothetical protein